MFYNIDFDALVRMLLPVRLRKNTTIHWLQCLVQPVKELYQRFMAARNEDLYTLSHNCQIVYLQAALNDMFDATGRGIYIAEWPGMAPLFTYLDAEDQPLWLGLAGETATTYPNPQWLYTAGETALSGYDFIIMIPAGVVWEEVRMRALTDKYRLPSRGNYTMITY